MASENLINASLQIVPLAGSEHYHNYIDAAIELIRNSGLKYMVTPMETVIEGRKGEVLRTLDEAREAALTAGADELLVNIKIHIKKNMDVTFDEKVNKFA
ncbi:MAG: thiamine-binding protein [Bacteroidota bacterium]